jgi:hypothetical protein
VSAAGSNTARQNIRDIAIDSPLLEDCHKRFLKLHSRTAGSLRYVLFKKQMA